MAESFQITALDVPIGADAVSVAVFATRQVSPGELVPTKGAFRFLITFPMSEETPFDCTAAYVKTFGRLLVGRKIWIRLRMITEKGLSSIDYETFKIVT